MARMKSNTPKRETKPEVVRVRVPVAVKRWLERAARQANVDMSDIVRPMILGAFNQRNTGRR